MRPRHTQDVGERSRTSAAFGAWAGLIRARPVWFTVAVAVMTVVLAGGLSRLEFDSGQDTMVSNTSQVYLDNLKFQSSFGGELMVVVFDGDLRQLFTAHNRAALAAVESDIAGSGRFHTVIGPDTAIEFADRQVGVAGPLTLAALARDQAAATTQAERDALAAAFAARTAADAQRLGAVGPQTLDNARYVEFLLFDEQGTVRPALRGAFPDVDHALLVARLNGNMSLDEQGVAVQDVERAVRDHPLDGIHTMVTGSAALTSEVNERTKSEMGRAGLYSVAAMVAVLLLVFRARWRLLVLPVIAVAMVWAFGAFGYLGVRLTMVTMSGLPILIGLGVDFAIQVHARYEEEATRAAGDPLRHALVGVGPPLLVALVAAAAGFVALRVSPVPMVDDFAVMLSVGTGMLLVAVLVFVPLALVWRDHRRGPRPVREGRHLGVERLVVALTASTRLRAPVVGGLALLVAVAGFVVNPMIPVESDSEKLVAADSPVLRDLHTLRDIAGTSAEAGFLVEADDVMRPDVLAWMARYERQELDRHRAALQSSNSIASITSQVTGSTPTPEDVRTVMAAAPAGIRDTFLDADAGRVQIAFSVSHVTLDDLGVLYDAMTADARATAPPGVRVVPSGLAVIGIETVHAYQEGRTSMTFAALAAVLVWLLLSLRSVRVALVALLPVVTAVGASSIAVYLLGLQVSLLAALSSPLVIAVCTEFSVLIIERYREERRRGLDPDLAITAASMSIGRAFTVSGLTIAAAFAVVSLSGFPLLASFGAVVAVNVVAAMACTLVILPPILRAAGARERPVPGGAAGVTSAPEPQPQSSNLT
jgi:hydrophobe/amphiphile efflux-3 (HAE3) family protein